MGRDELKNWISSSFVAQVLNLNLSSHIYLPTQPPFFISILTDGQNILLDIEFFLFQNPTSFRLYNFWGVKIGRFDLTGKELWRLYALSSSSKTVHRNGNVRPSILNVIIISSLKHPDLVGEKGREGFGGYFGLFLVIVQYFNCVEKSDLWGKYMISSVLIGWREFRH